MAETLYISINGTPKEVTDIYVGVNGVPKLVDFGYIGINNIPKKFFGNTDYIMADYWTLDNTITELLETGM